MSDNKNYYYLKLKDNFFDTDSMIVLESMQDGHLYSNILLKLYLRSLKCGGKLMFNERIPYSPQILANVTRHSVGVVEKALRVFCDLGLVEMLDSGAIYMLDIQNFIGESSTEADRKRAYRARIEKEKQGLFLGDGTNVQTNVGQTSDKTPPEIEIEIEIEKELELKKELEKDINTAPEKPATIILTELQEKFMGVLRSIENYPLNLKKDLDMYNRLEDKYKRLDLLEAIQEFALYKIDQPLKVKSNARSQISTSFKKYDEWGKCLKGAGNNGRPGQDSSEHQNAYSSLVRYD